MRLDPGKCHKGASPQRDDQPRVDQNEESLQVQANARPDLVCRGFPVPTTVVPWVAQDAVREEDTLAPESAGRKQEIEVAARRVTAERHSSPVGTQPTRRFCYEHDGSGDGTV